MLTIYCSSSLVLWRQELPVMCGFSEVIIPTEIAPILVTNASPDIECMESTSLFLDSSKVCNTLHTYYIHTTYMYAHFIN